ncbi:MAG TPA: hypothetical protein VIG08_04625 [Gemmatimonadales bacterium]|jgi:hypothetical protein
MADRVRKVSYCYPTVPHRAGQGARVLGALKAAGVDLLVFHGFPARGGKAQLDLFTDDMATVRKVAAKNGWRLSSVKRAFLIQGSDKPGAVHRHLTKLADARVRVTAATGIAAGAGRYGMILWVRQSDYAKASRALGAR